METTQAKHTAGPWSIYNRPINGNLPEPERFVFGVKGEHLLTTCLLFQDTGVSGETVEANARLIAAAPDLLEAAIFAEQTYRYPSDVESEIEALEKLRKAIAKVEGKEI